MQFKTRRNGRVLRLAFCNLKCSACENLAKQVSYLGFVYKKEAALLRQPLYKKINLYYFTSLMDFFLLPFCITNK